MFAMRPARFHRESFVPAEKPGTAATPPGKAAKIAICGTDASPHFLSQLVPAEAAALLRLWMSDHG
jgi:hypothetical protein